MKITFSLFKKSLLLVVLLSFSTTVTWAWGEKGHSMVAEVAFNNLDAKTKNIVLKYLDGMTIEEAANWMDVIKKDHSYDHLKPFHYADFDKGTKVKDTCCDNIIFQLTKSIKELKNYKTLSKEDIKTHLLYLFHLMGDLHQPLHIGYGNDKGGNDVKLFFYDKKTNLHGLFDYGIIEKKDITLKDCMNAKKYSSQELDKISKGNPLSWALESRSYLDEIYAYPTPISEAYIEKNTHIIEQQIQLAGIRLAAVLKETFKEN